MVQNNDDFIELTDIVPEGLPDKDGKDIIDLLDLTTDEKEDSAVTSTTREIDSKGKVETETSVGDANFKDGTGSPGEKEVSSVSHTEFEAALERVIEKKFSQTIETILFELTEKVIEKEIADIKASLQKDLDDIG
ncbi:MAG: hypothetical protein CSA29_02470 [Desulfobacterales bacterium]|nr:MAG: hypothetical protein CSA29_02470 [Desulfobacterales bacterium]